MKLPRRLRTYLAQLIKIGPSDRPLSMSVAAALAIGLPVLIGIYLGNFAAGLTASLGGLTYLNLPRANTRNRIVLAMSCAFGIIVSYGLGLTCQLMPVSMSICIGVIAVVSTMVCRYYGMGVVGGLFFVMAAAIGMFSPSGPQSVLIHIGLVALGAFLACAISFFDGLFVSHKSKLITSDIVPNRTFDYLLFDSVVIGIFVGISLGIAQLFNMDKPFWVPIACLTVIQGATFHTDWVKQIHCIVGTALGLIVTWILLSLQLSLLELCLTMMAFIFIIEALVARHYAFAAIFVTPVTFFLAEMVSFGTLNPTDLVWTRFMDTVLGCLTGILGAVFIHNHVLRILVRRFKLLK